LRASIIRRNWVRTALAVVLTILAPCAGAGAVPYTYTNLGPLVGGAYNMPTSINNHGEITGVAFRNGFDAWVLSDGRVTNLGKLGSDTGSAERINDAGQVLLNAQYNDGRAFVYTHVDGRTTQVPTAGYRRAFALDQNEAGVIVGLVSTPQTDRAAILGPTGGVRELGALTATGASYAHGINNRGQIVGMSHANVPGSGTSPYHAFFYENGVMTDLGTLGGPESLARDINDGGQIVGRAHLPNNSQPRAFLYENGRMAALPVLGTGQFVSAEAYAINELGQAVGYSAGIGQGTRAVLWEGGAITDLNSLVTLPAGWTLREAVDVNDLGDVVGWGTDAQGLQFTFLLDAPELPEPPVNVPLPAAVVMGAGMGVWVMGSRRGCRATGKP
jgi:probable HAF family extracellular repeat protein